MSDSVFDFDETEFPELYRLISGKIEDSDLIDVKGIPQELHVNAIRNYLDESNIPVREIGEMVPENSEDAEIFLDHTEVDLSPDEMAEKYRKQVHFLDHQKTGRDHHDRTVDALIEQALEQSVFEDYDAVFKEVDYKDFEYVPTQEKYDDLKIEKFWDKEEIVGSDADFIGFDLDNDLIDIKEVKTSSGYDARSERQIETFEKAVDYANQVAGTDFDVRSTTVYATNIIESENIIPSVYDGDRYVSKDVEDESFENIERFIDELLHGMEFAESQKLTDESPDAYIQSQSV